VLVLHAPRVTNCTQFAVMGPLLSPESKPFPADGPHLPKASHALLVGFLPLSPALLVTPARVELSPCNSPPLVVGLAATTPPHAVNEPPATMLVCLPDVGSELSRNPPMLVGNFGVLVCFPAMATRCISVMDTPPEAPPLASLPTMMIGMFMTFSCSLAVSLGDLGVCLGSLGKARTGHPLVAAPGSVAADAEALAAACDGREIGFGNQSPLHSVQSGTVSPVQVPAVPTNRTMPPPKTQLLQEVSPPPCLVLHFLAESSTACHHFCFAFLVLQACSDFSPPEPHLSCPSVRVNAVVPVPPLHVPEVVPASSTPFLVAGNACPSPGKIPSPAFLVLHAPRMTNSTQFAVMGLPLPPESQPFPAEGPHLLIASHTLLVGLHPLSPTLLVTSACVELPSCSGPPFVVSTGATRPPHAVNESTAAMLVTLPDVGSELG